MYVSELMSRDLITVEPQDSVEGAVKLLRRRGVRHLLVIDRKSTRLNSSHIQKSRMPSSA